MRLAPLGPEHRPRIEELLVGTAVFSTEEVAVALEVFDGCHPERASSHPERSEGSARVVIPSEFEGSAPAPGVIPSEVEGSAPAPGVIPSEVEGSAPAPGVIPSEVEGSAPAPGVIPSEVEGSAPAPGVIPSEFEGSAPAVPDYECIGAFDESDLLVGYACFGPTPATDGTYDLYWLAVDATAQRRGVGRALVRWVEQELGVRGARLLVVETSSRADYVHTREFYARGGYTEAARVRDFYAPADDRIILTTRLTQRERGAATR